MILKPLAEKPIQAYFGSGLHTLGLLGWILSQTGPASIFVSSYSTSEPFLNGVARLRDKGLVRHGILLLDHRAARKTLQLEQLMAGVFDSVMLGQNHSKVLLVHTNRMEVTVVTSQNQTYGDRAESTIVTTDKDVFSQMLEQFMDTCGNGGVEIDVRNGTGIITGDREAGAPANDAPADWQPLGAEW